MAHSEGDKRKSARTAAEAGLLANVPMDNIPLHAGISSFGNLEAMETHNPDRESAPIPSIEGGTKERAAQPKCIESIFIYNFSPEERSLLQSFRESTAAKTVLGHLAVPSPEFKVLDEWAHSSLHESFEFLTLIGNNFFEVTFTQLEGVQHTLQNSFFFVGKKSPSPRPQLA